MLEKSCCGLPHNGKKLLYSLRTVSEHQVYWYLEILSDRGELCQSMGTGFCFCHHQFNAGYVPATLICLFATQIIHEEQRVHLTVGA